MKIKANEITSVSIRAQAIADKVDQIDLIDELDHPDHPGDKNWTIRLYDYSGVRVIETNGDPIWEESDPVGFSETLAEYDV